MEKSQAWRVIRNGECVGTVYYLARCKEAHVLACVKHDFGSRDLTIEKG